MNRHSRNHYILLSIVLVIAINLAFFFYYFEKTKTDYANQISGLYTYIDKLEKDIGDKQSQIDQLDSKVQETSLQIVKTNEQYDLQMGELNQKLGDLAVESDSFSETISRVIDATVIVTTNLGSGSGAIISSDGYTITNYHVIDGAKRASIITYEGNRYGVTLVGYDMNNDLALLKINSNDTFNYFEFGDSDKIKPGQKVVALGNPAGLSFTATEGIISATSRQASDGLYYIQTDVTLNPGNSGGPLINSLGEIIGIVDFKVSGYEELGFAIPINRAKEVIDKITA